MKQGMTSCLANLPLSYLVRNTPMKSVFRPSQVLPTEKRAIDMNKEARDGKDVVLTIHR